ncbi:MAG: MATE family efflux transporter [Rikenellaceae bacterium]
MVKANFEGRRVAKNTLLLYFRMLVSMLILLYSSRVILNRLGVEDFGIYTIVAGVLTLLLFVSNSINGASVRFICAYEKEENPTIFSSIFFIHLIFSLLVVVLGETIGLWIIKNKLNISPNRVQEAVTLFHYVILTSITTFLYSPYNSLIIAKEQFKPFAIIDILNVVLKLLAALSLSYFSEKRLVYYGKFLFLVSFITFLCYFFYCYRNIPESRLRPTLSKEKVRAVGRFAAIDLYGNMSTVGMIQGVNLLINLFFGTLVNAAYGVSLQVQAAVMAFSINIQTALKPQIIKSYTEQNIQKFTFLIESGLKYTTLLLYIISLPLILRIDYILSLWLGDVPEYTAQFVSCMLIANIGSSLTNVLSMAIHGVGDIRRLSFINGTLYLLVIPTTYLAFRLGMEPIFPFVFNIVIVFLAFASNCYTIKLLVEKIQILKILKCSLIPLIKLIVVTFPIIFVIARFLNKTFVDLLLLSLISTLIIVLVSWFTVLNRDIKQEIMARWNF